MFRFVAVLLAISIHMCVEAKSWKEEVKSLPQEEKIILEEFFHTLLTESHGGYVIFGNKPLCIEGFVAEESAIPFLDQEIHRPSIRLKEGIRIWKKHDFDRFCRNYFFQVSNDPVFGYQHLILVNKQELIKVMSNHLSLFQYILGPKFTPEGFFSKIVGTDQNFHKMICFNWAIEGILLGYGTQNAIQYARAEKIRDSLRNLGNELPSQGFSSLEEELAWLEKKSVLSNSFNENKTLLLPAFGCFDLKESEALIDLYKKTQGELLNIINSESWFEDTLARFFD